MPRKHGWRTVSSSERYRNAWISVREDKVVYPDGSRGIYGVVEKGPGVSVVPVAADGSVYLLRQYRYTVDAELWELPAGAIVGREGERSAVRRELAEELGMSASRLRRLGDFYTAVGHETAEIIAYRAAGLRPVAPRRQGDESILEARRFTRTELRRLMAANKINCGITLASLALYLELER